MNETEKEHLHHDNPFNAAVFHFSKKFLPVTNKRQLINDNKIAGDSIYKCLFNDAVIY
jgi:hypothetical protein